MNPSDQRGGVVDTITLISNQMGTAPMIVNAQLRRPETQIEIDGKVWEGDKHSLPIDQILGKEIVVVGRDLHWRFVYNG